MACARSRHLRRRLVHARVDRAVGHELAGLPRLLVRERDAVRRGEQPRAGRLLDPLLQDGRPAPLAAARLVLAPGRLDVARLVDRAHQLDVARAVAVGRLEHHRRAPGDGPAVVHGVEVPRARLRDPVRRPDRRRHELVRRGDEGGDGVQQGHPGALEQRGDAQRRGAGHDLLHQDVGDGERPAVGGGPRRAPAGADARHAVDFDAPFGQGTGPGVGIARAEVLGIVRVRRERLSRGSSYPAGRASESPIGAPPLDGWSASRPPCRRVRSAGMGARAQRRTQGLRAALPPSAAWDAWLDASGRGGAGLRALPVANRAVVAGRGAAGLGGLARTARRPSAAAGSAG